MSEPCAAAELKRKATKVYVQTLIAGNSEADAIRAAREAWPNYYPNGMPSDIRTSALTFADGMRKRK
jgi:hypothetical protein